MKVWVHKNLADFPKDLDFQKFPGYPIRGQCTLPMVLLCLESWGSRISPNLSSGWFTSSSQGRSSRKKSWAFDSKKVSSLKFWLNQVFVSSRVLEKNLSQNSTKSFSSPFSHPSTCILQNVAMVIYCIASFITLPVDTDGYNIENSIYCQKWKVGQGSLMNLCLSTNFT